MERSISLQSFVDDWLGMLTTKALNKKIVTGINNEYHACAKDVRMTQLLQKVKQHKNKPIYHNKL